MFFEQMSVLRGHNEERTRQLRRRYAALALEALRPEASTGKLAGSPPTDAGLGERWVAS